MGSFGNQLTNGKQTNTGKRDRTVRSPLRHKWLLGITFNPPTPLQRDRVDPIAKMQSSMHPIEAVFWASGYGSMWSNAWSDANSTISPVSLWQKVVLPFASCAME